MNTIEQFMPAFAQGDHAPSRNYARVVASSLPAWLTRAPAPLRKALRDSQADSHAARQALKAWLTPLQGLDAYAEQALRAALKPLAGTVDVRATVLARLRNIESMSVPRLHMSQQSLLHAALQNFVEDEVFEAGSGLLPVGALNIADGGRTYRVAPGAALPITPSAFAAACRELDIGQAYQTHLQAFFAPATDNSRVVALFTDNDRHALAVHAHIARLRGDVTEAAYRMLLDVASGKPATWQGQAVRVSALSLLHSSLFSGGDLQGPLLLDTVGQEGCVLFLPQAPGQPLTQYPSFQALHDALRERLREPAWLRYFMGFVSQRSAVEFTEHLKDRLTPLVTTFPSAPQREPNPHAHLNLQRIELTGELFAAIHVRRVARVLDDAKVLAVPTADIDARERDLRNGRWLSAGLDLLGMAAFLVPGLGEVLLACAAVQLVNEVYTGVQDWRLGDDDAAFTHAMSVAENLATLAVMTGASQLAHMPALPRWPAGQVFEELVPVRLPNGRERLHRPTLEGYERAVALPADLVAESDGLYFHDDQDYARIDDKVYAVRHDGPSRAWRVMHPDDPLAFEPLLARTTAGHWQLAASQQVEVQGQRLRDLLHAPLAYLDEASIELALRCTGAEPGELEQTYSARNRVSALLNDTLVRFAVDQALTQHQAGTVISNPSLAFKLAEHLADETADTSDSGLFEALYHASHFGSSAASKVLLRDFALLPPQLADEILSAHGPKAQAAIVKSGRLPLDVAQQARASQQALRLNRALEGLCLPRQINLDSELLTAKWREQLSADASDLQVREAALADREQCARWLEQKAPEPFFSAPTRDERGRWGYAMGGRRASSVRVTKLELQRKIRSLYPRFTTREALVYLRTLIATSGDYAHALAVLQEREAQFAELELSLDYWVDLPGSATALSRVNGAVEELRDQRSEVASRLRAAWRLNGPEEYDRNMDEFLLDLRGLSLIDLPPLLNGFNFLRSVDLRDCHLQAQGLADMLFNFPRLRSLHLNGTGLESLPDFTRHASTLETLDLSGNHLVIDQGGIDHLGQLARLRSLSLNGNLIMGVSHVNGLAQLQRLDLAHCALGAWPAWAEQLPALQVLDLSHAGLASLPSHVMTALHPGPTVEVELHGNPLTVQAQRDVELAASLVGRRYQFFRTRTDVGTLQTDALATPWLVGLDVLQQQMLREHFFNLKQRVDAEDFLRMVDDLSRTPEYTLNRADVSRRVRHVMSLASSLRLVRQRVFGIATARFAGPDGLLLGFSDAEVAVFRLEHRVSDAMDVRGARLYSRLRSMFRIDRLRSYSADALVARALARQWTDQTAFRLHLRSVIGERLALPGQPLGLPVATESLATDAELLAAQRFIQAEERSERFIHYLAEQREWREHVLRHHRTRIEADLAPLLAGPGLVRAQVEDELYLQLTREERERFDPPAP